MYSKQEVEIENVNWIVTKNCQNRKVRSSETKIMETTKQNQPAPMKAMKAMNRKNRRTEQMKTPTPTMERKERRRAIPEKIRA
jgi:hypothetical protein